MLTDGLLTRVGKGYGLAHTNLLADFLISGYTQVLRPKLTLGRFRPAEKSAKPFSPGFARTFRRAFGIRSVAARPPTFSSISIMDLK